MDGVPHTDSEVQLQSIVPSWYHAFRVWWCWAWRVIFVTFLLTTAVTFWIGTLAGVVGMTDHDVTVVSRVFSIVFFAAVGVYFTKDTLDRDFGSFRVCIISKHLKDS